MGDQDSARVLARVGHLIGDGLGAYPVASIGLRSFRVYRGVVSSRPVKFGGVGGVSGSWGVLV